MNDIFSQAWNFKIDFLPVLATLVVFEASSLVRRYMRWTYLPIYFMFFPLGHADKLYAEYVDEDDFYMVGAYMEPREKRLLRIKIIATSFWSMLFSVIFNPIVAGIFSAAFLNDQQFWQFITTLLLLKIFLLSISLWKLRIVSFVTSTGSFGAIVVLYIVYILTIWRITTSAFEWALSKISNGTFYQLAIASVDFLVFQIGIYGIVPAGLGAAVSYWMTNPEVIPERRNDDSEEGR